MANPATVTGGIGVLLNLYNLKDLMAQFNIVGIPIKAGKNVDLGSPIKAIDPAGRKLDFLAQEFNREANTLCSKSSDIQLTHVGLALKAVIDQFREQVQNVE